MSPTWHGTEPPPELRKLDAPAWGRVLLKLPCLAVLVFGGLAVLLAIRLGERPLCGVRRPVTPHITVFVCRNALRILGLRLQIFGSISPDVGAVVSNHSSWLDIFALNALKRVYFVSKSEVADWPGIGWLARATGTVFIDRKRGRAAQQTALLRERLAAGHRLLFFPEGTSSDGQRVLPFKSTLFAAFFDLSLHDGFQVQPVSVHYSAPPRQDQRFFSWWGDMEFGSHFLQVLAYGAGGAVTVRYHAPVHKSQAKDRKALAAICETSVRRGFALPG